MPKAKRILIVEDEPGLSEMLQVRLESVGHEVSVAADGLEGLSKARSEKPDLILLDVMMPKMNGYQVCRELKKDPATKGILILMLTAKAQESDKFWGKETGADDYITKPFEMGDLLKKIGALFANSG